MIWFFILLSVATTSITDTEHFCPVPDWQLNHGHTDFKVPRSRQTLPLTIVAPDYPSIAQDEDISGATRISFVVGLSGLPSEVKLIGSDHQLFTDAVLSVIAKWRYVPAIENCVNVISSVQTVMIKFEEDAVEVFH